MRHCPGHERRKFRRRRPPRRARATGLGESRLLRMAAATGAQGKSQSGVKREVAGEVAAGAPSERQGPVASTGRVCRQAVGGGGSEGRSAVVWGGRKSDAPQACVATEDTSVANSSSLCPASSGTHARHGRSAGPWLRCIPISYPPEAPPPGTPPPPRRPPHLAPPPPLLPPEFTADHKHSSWPRPRPASPFPAAVEATSPIGWIM